MDELLSIFEADDSTPISTSTLTGITTADERIIVIMFGLSSFVSKTIEFLPPYVVIEFWEDCDVGTIIIDVFALE